MASARASHKKRAQSSCGMSSAAVVIKIGRVVYDLYPDRRPKLGDDCVDRGIAAHKSSILLPVVTMVFSHPEQIKGCCAAEVQRIGNVGVIGVVRFWRSLKASKATFDLGFGGV